MAENEKNETPADDEAAETPSSEPESAEPKSTESKPVEPKPAAKDEPTAEEEDDATEVPSGGGSQQRHVRNYLLQPPFQVQLAIYNCILALGFAVALVGVLYSKLSRLEVRLGYLQDVPASVRDALDATLSDSALYMVILALIFVIASVAVTIILTHRLVGPAYAFRRQINELTSGRYDARIHLRRHDAFLEVAEDLNKLAETLQRERGGLASSANSLIEMDP